MSKNMSRRSFLQTSAMAAGAAAIASTPFWSTSASAAAPKKAKKAAATDRLNIVGVGIGGRGAADINGMESQNIVALCDCDWNYAANEMARFPNAKKFILVVLIVLFVLVLIVFAVFMVIVRIRRERHRKAKAAARRRKRMQQERIARQRAAETDRMK